jgi:hypothetical protein
MRIGDVELTPRELDWVSVWLVRKGITMPSAEDLREALLALQAYNEARTLQASSRVH